MRKYIKAGLFVFVLIAILVSLLPLPSTIRTTITGIKWISANPAYCEPADISINGKYYRYLFKRNVFKGHITLSGDKRTAVDDSTMFDISFIKRKGYNDGWMVYDYVPDHDIVSIGEIFINRSFTKIVICLYDKERNDLISAPASDRDIAYQLAMGLGVAQPCGIKKSY